MTHDYGAVDPSVWRAVESQAARGSAEPRVSVVIQLAQRIRVPDETGDASARLMAVEREVEVLQRDLLAHLDHLGVKNRPRALALVNAVAVDLTAEEIRSVAQRTDVRRIVLAEPKHVAT